MRWLDSVAVRSTKVADPLQSDLRWQAEGVRAGGPCAEDFWGCAREEEIGVGKIGAARSPYYGCAWVWKLKALSISVRGRRCEELRIRRRAMVGGANLHGEIWRRRAESAMTSGCRGYGLKCGSSRHCRL